MNLQVSNITREKFNFMKNVELERLCIVKFHDKSLQINELRFYSDRRCLSQALEGENGKIFLSTVQLR